MFTLFTIIFTGVAFLLDKALGLASEPSGYGPIYGLYAIGTILPSLALSVRRLHDIGKSGWWLLLALVPLIGAIVLLIWAIKEGDRGSNAFGPDPKGGDGLAATAA